MVIRCVWEHNGADSLVWAENFPGAYARSADLQTALQKLPGDVRRLLRWQGEDAPTVLLPQVVQEKTTGLTVRDADSDVLFEAERAPLIRQEYETLKKLALQSARDFLAVYEAVPDKDRSALPQRESFYGPVPRTAQEMYDHTKNVNGYYFGEIGVAAGNEGDIVNCRQRGFALLEQQPGYLEMPVRVGSYDEEWSLRKVCRRFIWHDRIHAKAMLRMAAVTFGAGIVPDPFGLVGE